MFDARGNEDPRPAPGQTIVIQQKERKGCLRRLASPVLLLILIGALFFNIFSKDSGLLPNPLTERYVAGEFSKAEKVAVVEVTGMIFGETVEHAIKQIRQARDDKGVKAVVLRVDSPGGTVSGSDRIWREVELLRLKGKPVVASMGGTAASGGYYVAAPADYIFAEPTTLTGSIGVVAEFPQLKGLLDKVGVDFETIATGPWKDAGNPFRPMTDRERSRWHELLDASYQRFVRVVAQGRKIPLSDVLDLANGKVYTADEALRLKLVNAIGYQDDAVETAMKRAGLSSARVIRYSRSMSLRDALLGITAPQPGIKLDAESWLSLQTPQVLFLAR